MLPPPPRSTLFPYTTLFRSRSTPAGPSSGFRWPPFPRSRTSASTTRISCSGRCRRAGARSEEHTSELQSRGHLVCRLLLEKKNKQHLRILTHHSQLLSCTIT